MDVDPETGMLITQDSSSEAHPVETIEQWSAALVEALQIILNESRCRTQCYEKPQPKPSNSAKAAAGRAATRRDAK